MGFGDVLSKLFRKESEKEIKNENEVKKEVSFTGEEKNDTLGAQESDEAFESVGEGDVESFSDFFDGEVYTETMAHIYMNQGLYEQAVRIFERLLKQEPQNESLRKNLYQAKTYLLSKKAGRILD